MSKMTTLALGLITVTLALTSCSSMPKEIKVEDVKEETLYVRKDGSNQVAYVEDFSEQYLNVNELKGYIAAELSDYNKKYGDKAAELSGITLENGKVKAVLTFKNNGVFTDFNGKKGEDNVKFPGANEALTEFEGLKFAEVNSDDVEKTAKEVLTDEYNIAVINGSLLLQTGGKIKYYSGGNLEDEHHIRVDEGNEAVVVYSK